MTERTPDHLARVVADALAGFTIGTKPPPLDAPVVQAIVAAVVRASGAGLGGTSRTEWAVQYDDGRVNGPTTREMADYLSTRDGQQFTVVQRQVTEWSPDPAPDDTTDRA